MHVLVLRLKESLYAVVPIVALVLILSFTLAPLDTSDIVAFLVGSLLVTVGLAVFLFGVDVGITPIGNALGSLITKANSLWLVVASGISLGFFISIAEPDLHILGDQVEAVTAGGISKVSILVIVSVGIAVTLSLGLVRIVHNVPLYKVLTVLYSAILILGIFTSPEFLAISFDASGATTGALAVPFILALAVGVSELKKDSKASENDSFGLVAIVSAGAIMAVMIMSVFSNDDGMTGTLTLAQTDSTSIVASLLRELPTVSGEIFLALLPILLVFLVIQRVSLKASRRAFRRILIGLLLTFVGVVLFLTGAHVGFMDVGVTLGYEIGSMDNKVYVLIVGFALGLVVVLAEPAVHVLTHQIENVTSGYVSRRAVAVALSIGVGFAVALSMLRILVPEIQLWHYLLPGYLLSIAMTYWVPKLFVGIAFDSGGVASGPMTVTFVLGFTHGVAEAVEGASVLVEGFGVIAMVALTPIVAVQVLGGIFKLYSGKKGV
jgi:hypothetical protein